MLFYGTITKERIIFVLFTYWLIFQDELNPMPSVNQEICPSEQNQASPFYQSLTARLEFPRQWLHLGKKIGQGEFGDVFAATVKGTNSQMLEGKRVAVKVLKGTSYHYFFLYFYHWIFFNPHANHQL